MTANEEVYYSFLKNLQYVFSELERIEDDYADSLDRLLYFMNINNEDNNKVCTNYYNNIYANISKVKMIFLLKDEKYIDYYIKGNAILSLNSSIIKELFSRINNNGDNNKVPLTFYDESIIVDLCSCSFLGDCNLFLF